MSGMAGTALAIPFFEGEKNGITFQLMRVSQNSVVAPDV